MPNENEPNSDYQQQKDAGLLKKAKTMRATEIIVGNMKTYIPEDVEIEVARIDEFCQCFWNRSNKIECIYLSRDDFELLP